MPPRPTNTDAVMAGSARMSERLQHQLLEVDIGAREMIPAKLMGSLLYPLAPLTSTHPEPLHSPTDDLLPLDLSTSGYPLNKTPSTRAKERDVVTSPLMSRSRTLPKMTSTKSDVILFGPMSPSLDKVLDGGVQAEFDTEPWMMELDRRAALNRWVMGIAVVNFDLDIGPVVDRMYPEIEMSNAEKENIAFSSFPDGSLFETGVQSHSFRLRSVTSSEPHLKSSTGEAKKNHGDGFIYGYALFMQKRDASIKRGYLQRSIVLLSHLPYPSLFTAAITKLGTFYFSHGATMLETACHNIASWPDPVPGEALELGFLGSVLFAEIPRHESEHQSMSTMSFGERYNPSVHILASLPAPFPSPISLFSSFLSQVWALWECLVLSEPLLIFAPSPMQTSAIVWWLRDFLRPIPLAGDFRPYFHIHDRDYSRFINKNPPRSGLILGVTNPFFENLCGHWPHILAVGREGGAQKTQTRPHATPFMGPSPGFHTKHKRFMSKDRQLLKKLEEALDKGGAAEVDACRVLREHFSDRSQKLLVPLNRHLQSLIPVDPRDPIKPFTPTSFLTSLKTHGSLLPFRSTGKQKEFYERWLKTPAFGVWLTERVEEIQNVLDSRLRTIKN